MKEMLTVCNLSNGVYNKGMEAGVKKGEKKGREEGKHEGCRF